MLKQIQALSNSDVFTIVLENEPEKTKYWFRATELCELLFSKSNSQKYVKLHCKDWQYREFQNGNGRPALYVCESGVYRLILRSKAPIAIEFQDWLTEDLLPKLRKQGIYVIKSNDESLLEYEARVAELNEVNNYILDENRQLKDQNLYLKGKYDEMKHDLINLDTFKNTLDYLQDWLGFDSEYRDVIEKFCENDLNIDIERNEYGNYHYSADDRGNWLIHLIYHTCNDERIKDLISDRYVVPDIQWSKFFGLTEDGYLYATRTRNRLTV